MPVPRSHPSYGSFQPHLVRSAANTLVHTRVSYSHKHYQAASVSSPSGNGQPHLGAASVFTHTWKPASMLPDQPQDILVPIQVSVRLKVSWHLICTTSASISQQSASSPPRQPQNILVQIQISGWLEVSLLTLVSRERISVKNKIAARSSFEGQPRHLWSAAGHPGSSPNRYPFCRSPASASASLHLVSLPMPWSAADCASSNSNPIRHLQVGGSPNIAMVSCYILVSLHFPSSAACSMVYNEITARMDVSPYKIEVSRRIILVSLRLLMLISAAQLDIVYRNRTWHGTSASTRFRSTAIRSCQTLC